ncbi:MAG: hypothetical protein HETSPECPRED_004486, partial [Heterodermia speciosa]
TNLFRGAPEGLELGFDWESTNQTISTSAFSATISLAMLNITAYPLDKELNHFDYTVDARDGGLLPVLHPFIMNVNIKKTPIGQQLPFRMTRKDATDTLGSLGWIIPVTTEPDSFKEILFELWLFDPKAFSFKDAKLVAKGGIVKVSQLGHATTT